MPQKLYSHNIRQLPKIDLHRHLDCSLRWSTVNELALELGYTLPPDIRLRKEEYLVTSPMLDLQSVLKKFLNTQKVLATEKILERMAFEACEDAFNDGVYLLELRYAPTFIADGHSNLSFDNIHQAILRGIERAQKVYPMAVGLICILQRIKPLEEAKKVTDFAIANKDTFIAIDLADNELGFEPEPFAPLFQKAQKAGLHITVHSGEAPHPQAGKWIRDSIEILGAERIGHGVQVLHHPKEVELLKQKQIVLEVCPISNYLTQAFKTYEAHPLRQLMNAGILVTINSDDPGVFATNLSDDYHVLAENFAFNEKEFQRCNQVAYQHSFIAENKKSPFKSLFFE